ncbi:MAG: peptidase C11, partial [Clostridia bacterium]|nr:peptidase C11 [Clostridia bacterium]
MSGYGSDMLSSLLGGSWYSGQTGFGATAPATATTTTTSSSSGGGANMSSVNRSVASGSRAKYTTIKGNNKDTFTLMIYMCGADLESRSAMGTKDLQEMLSAKFGDSVRVIVYTGGSTNWRNNLVSSKVNQIWQVKNGQMICLQENAGTGAMTNQATLTSFIQYCAKNFKANRYALILWDHGSGSVAGYGYDERNKNSGSMSLAGLDNAFRNGGVKFDFIGFDACLMATLENALMTSKYADYLIASEETEPGIGWYYTDWLTALGSNTSIST